jgi:hypothetical protein
MKKTNIKLKTLKDLDVSNVFTSDLKSAAKEWIKYIKDHMEKIHHHDTYHQGSINWIETFFNLKEKPSLDN